MPWIERFRGRSADTATVVDGVLELLACGELRPLQEFPPQPDLRARFGAGRREVRSATDVLMRSGVIETRRHGRIFFVQRAADPNLAHQARSVAQL